MKREVKRGTYLVEFEGGDRVIFGNNYKPWWQHALEFTYREYGNREKGWRYEDVCSVLKSVKYSNQPFYDDGGLKWCGFDSYQSLIDDVCKQQQLAPVKLADIVFNESEKDKAILIKELKRY